MQADLIAGLTVGVMTVPEALSYARIAGLPSEYGLYGAFMPVLAYAIFGSSRQMVAPDIPLQNTYNCWELDITKMSTGKICISDIEGNLI